MKVEEKNISKVKSSFFLTEDARKIIDDKVKAWGISKSGVVELSLRQIDKKDSLNRE